MVSDPDPVHHGNWAWIQVFQHKTKPDPKFHTHKILDPDSTKIPRIIILWVDLSWRKFQLHSFLYKFGMFNVYITCFLSIKNLGFFLPDYDQFCGNSCCALLLVIAILVRGCTISDFCACMQGILLWKGITKQGYQGPKCVIFKSGRAKLY